MALILADRVKVRSQTAGTGSLTLTETVFGFRGFSAVGDGNETYYGILDNAGNWEIGRGTVSSSGTVLSRDTILSSSNSGSLVNFPAGGKNVFGTLPASVANSIAAAAPDNFKNIAVAGQSTIIADSTNDTLTLVAGTGIDITTNAGTDTITIAFEGGVGDIKGSVFADDSTLLVDAVSANLRYYPAAAGDWAGTAPSTVGGALDRLATVVKALNGGTGA